jgi:putative hemolysin
LALTFASMPQAEGAQAFLQRFARKRDLAGIGPVLARAGALEARLAATGKEVRRAQGLRYRIFFEEGGAIPNPAARLTRRDLCRFDSVCDHLVVVDRMAPARDGSPSVVGVYRLLRQDVAERNFGFYSSREFEVERLIARHPGMRFLEVGRACIAETHRGRRVLELLWRGLWAYARHHAIDAMIGCASLPGADPRAHAATIRWLAASGGDPSWRVAPRSDRRFTRDDDGARRGLDARALARRLPPLVKGYWRLGATFSPVPAVDAAFGATDLFVAMPLSDIEARYLKHFGVEALRRPLAA